MPSAGGRRKPVSEGSFYVTAVKMAQERLTTESRGVRGGRAFRRGEVESQRVGRTGHFREPLGELAIQGVRARDPISHEDTHVPTRTHKHTYTCTHTHIRVPVETGGKDTVPLINILSQARLLSAACSGFLLDTRPGAHAASHGAHAGIGLPMPG